MNLSVREIKRRARTLMKSSVKPSPLAVALVFTVITAAASFFLGRIGGVTAIIDGERMEELSAMAQAGQMPAWEDFLEAVEMRQPKSTTVSNMLELALQLVGVIVTAGFSLYALRHARGQGGEMGNLLDGFAQFYRVSMVYFLQSLLIMLGFCCFVIPGVRLAYGYRMTNYLLWDHPDWGPVEILRNSRLLMNGRRRKVFAMDVSFLLWIILGSVPFSVAGFCLDQTLYGSMIAALAAGCALSAFASLYRELSLTVYYQSALGENMNDTSEKPPWEY